jgi:hypothetical protein
MAQLSVDTRAHSPHQDSRGECKRRQRLAAVHYNTRQQDEAWSVRRSFVN